MGIFAAVVGVRRLAALLIFGVAALAVYVDLRPVSIPNLRQTASITFTEYPAIGRVPLHIHGGPDMRMYYTSQQDRSIVAINPDGSGSVQYPLPTTECSPQDLVIGPEGDIYFTEPNCNHIGRMTITGTFVTAYSWPQFSSQMPFNGPWDIVLGPDNNLWFTVQNAVSGTGLDGSFSEVGVLNPVTGLISFVDLPRDSGHPNGIMVGPDQNIWVAEPNSGELARILVVDHSVKEFPLGANPSELATGADGDIWFAGTPANNFGKLHLTGANTGTVTTYAFPGGFASYPVYDVAAASDGNIWYTASRITSAGTAEGVLGNFDVHGAVQDFALPPGPNPCCARTPFGIFSDRNRQQVWYTDRLHNLVGHVDAFAGSSGPPASEFSGGRNPSEPLVTCTVCAYPINPAFGDMWHSFVDLSIPGRGPAFALERTYDSLSAALDGPLGFGWTHSYNMNLKLDAAGNATVFQENGSQTVFKAAAGGLFVSGPRVLATLTRNPDGSFTLRRNDQTTFTFNPSGQLVAEGDRNGNTTTLAYGGGHLASVSDPAGRKVVFAYNPDGHLASVTDPAGRQVSYQYGNTGDLVAATDGGGATWHFAYDSKHHLTAMTDAKGGVSTNTYDSTGRATAQQDPMGRTWAFRYQPGQTTITHPNGRNDSFTFDQALITSVTRAVGTPLQQTTSYQHDPATGGFTKETDPNGHVTSVSYDARGNILSTADGSGGTTTYAYSALNDVLSMTDPLGVTTNYSRDARGNLTARARPLISAGQIVQISYVYENAAHPGDLTAEVDQLGKRWTVSYDAAGDVVKVTDPLGNHVSLVFDGIGRLMSAVSAGGRAYKRTFNAYDEMLSITDPLGSVTSYQYDLMHNPVAVKDANGRTTMYAYDADNEPIGVTHADGSQTASAFNADGAVTANVDGAGRTTGSAYDLLDRVVSTTDPLGRVTSNGYDAFGNRTSITDPGGRTSSYLYDAANRLVGIAYADGTTPAVSVVYDAASRRVQMTDGTGISSYSYDSLNRLIATTDGAGQVTLYGYDLRGQVTSLTYPSGAVVTRTYDAAGHLATVTDWTGHTNRLAYDADGDITSLVLGNGVRGTLSYDAAKNLVAIRYDAPRADGADGHSGQSLQARELSFTEGDGGGGGGDSSGNGGNSGGDGNGNGGNGGGDSNGNGNGGNGGGGNALLGWRYQRDRLGQVVSVTPLGDQSGAPQTYTYDAANRLVAAGPAQGDGNGQRQTFAYDHSGDLTQTTSGGQDTGATTTNFTYDAAHQLVQSATQGGDQGPQTLSYSFDANGNRTQVKNGTGAAVASYAYDQANRLIGLNGTAQYAYSGDGLRTSKTVAGAQHKFAWDLAGGTPDLLSDGSAQYVYGPGGMPLEQVGASGRPEFFLTDQQGSTRALTSDTGGVTARFEYDPYGSLIRSDGPGATPILYGGQYRDSESGLYFLRTRYYDPATAQYLTVDPLADVAGQRYGYAAQDPINRSDPTGLWPQWAMDLWKTWGPNFGLIGDIFTGVGLLCPPLYGIASGISAAFGVAAAIYDCTSNDKKSGKIDLGACIWDIVSSVATALVGVLKVIPTIMKLPKLLAAHRMGFLIDALVSWAGVPKLIKIVNGIYWLAKTAEKIDKPLSGALAAIDEAMNGVKQWLEAQPGQGGKLTNPAPAC